MQLKAEDVRRLAVVDEPWLRLIQTFDSVYALAQEAIRSGRRLTTLIEEHLTKDTVEYDAIYRGGAEWKLLPPIEHPQEPGRCLVSGTRLTHGLMVRAHGDPLLIPPYAEDGGEEAEIAAAYLGKH